jgi:cell division protein FtsW
MPDLRFKTVTDKASNDRILFIGISILLLFGLLMVYSSSIAAGARKGTPSCYFLRQLLYAGIGYVLMIRLMFVDYHVWLKPKIIILLSALSILLLGLVFIFEPIKGAQRTLRLEPWVTFQPSELAKLVLLLFLAFFIQANRSEIRQPGFRPYSWMLYVGLFAGLIIREPDFGQALFIVLVSAVLLFIAGFDRKHVWIALLLSGPAFYLFIWRVLYRRLRFLAWLKALLNPLYGDYQTRQAAIALGRGGLFGAGFGESLQKFFFLPEATTDFIYAVIGEEFGLLGTVLVAGAFLGFLYLGVKISLRAPDTGGFYLGLGITMMVAMQAFINISSALALIPTEGLTLPFISRGGSSLLVSLMAIGILINIASQRKADEDR